MRYLTLFMVCAIGGLLSYRMGRRESTWLDLLVLVALVIWATLVGRTWR